MIKFSKMHLLKSTRLRVGGLGIVGVVALLSADTKIDLGGSKEHVLVAKKRSVALELSEGYLQSADRAQFAEDVEGVASPFAFKVKAKPVVAEKEAVEDVVAKTVFDEASILARIGSDFTKQIRGTMSRGDRFYIQLKSGKLMKSGFTFPATVPEVGERSFEVELEAIRADDYTLRMGGLRQTFPYVVNDDKNGGRARRD